MERISNESGVKIIRKRMEKEYTGTNPLEGRNGGLEVADVSIGVEEVIITAKSRLDFAFLE